MIRYPAAKSLHQPCGEEDLNATGRCHLVLEPLWERDNTRRSFHSMLVRPIVAAMPNPTTLSSTPAWLDRSRKPPSSLSTISMRDAVALCLRLTGLTTPAARF